VTHYTDFITKEKYIQSEACTSTKGNGLKNIYFQSEKSSTYIMVWFFIVKNSIIYTEPTHLLPSMVSGLASVSLTVQFKPFKY